MDLKATLHAGSFKPLLEGNTKAAVIEELVDLLMQNEGVADRQAVLDCILKREQKMTTGMQQGIAIPHGKTPAVSGLHAAVGLKPEGVDFAALDGELSSIFIITVSPENDSGPHIEFLAAVSKQLCSEGVRTKVLQSSSKEELLAALEVEEEAG